MSLRGTIARRLAFSVFAVYVVISLLFGLVTFAPNPQLSVLLQQASTEGEAREIRREFRRSRGLDEPILDRYLDWLIDVPTLDWGQSYGTIGAQYGPSYEANATAGTTYRSVGTSASATSFVRASFSPRSELRPGLGD